jgi:hypothetical protein
MSSADHSEPAQRESVSATKYGATSGGGSG